MSKVEAVYNHVLYDADLARMAWAIVKTLETTDRRSWPEYIGVTFNDDEGLSLCKFEPGDEEDNEDLLSAIRVESNDVSDLDGETEAELIRAMRFMYFYQSLHATVESNALKKL